ncbi:MAG: HDOD domain-containing protein [Deltaproteobacteria bacterium]|nr:HDOD domain-containing protein [Deltaproteobacteria bacterium]
MHAHKTKSVERIVASISGLPPFPEVARRVLELSRDPDISNKEIAEVLKYDDAITANCLKLCNSSYYSLSVKVFSMHQAVNMLGLKNIIMIALASTKSLSAYAKAQQKYCMTKGELWRHSVTTAIISQLLLKYANMNEDSILFTAALLHDFGKIVLDQYMEGDVENLVELTQKEGVSLLDAEKEVFGIDHAELGGLIAEEWNFPSMLVNSIRNHHHEISSDHIPNVESWVRLSNLVFYLSFSKLTQSYHKGIMCGIDPNVLSRYRLKSEDIDAVIKALPAEIRKTEAMLKIAF